MIRAVKTPAPLTASKGSRVPDPEDGRDVYLTGWQLNDEIEKEWAASA
jgi:hypothetical protein